MITLSLCMIVKNESAVLDRCLTCVKDIADEIVIVDTGSSDDTKEIAGRFTDKVYDFAWCDDFAAARNFSFSKATMQYTMWLDADDVIDEENRALLKALKQDLSPETDMVFMRYDVAFDAHGRPTMSFFRERLMRTAMQYRWVGEIHEVIQRAGAVEHRDIRIQHKKILANEPGRNLRIFKKMLADGKDFDPRQRFYYARELMYAKEYPLAVSTFETFLNNEDGWAEDKINACKDAAFCLNQLNQSSKALTSLFRSFEFSAPRAELCCDIGIHFVNLKQYQTAIFWYELAAQRPFDPAEQPFSLPDCYGFLPFMQLCLCYDRIGDHTTASAYNEKAAAIKPEDDGVLYNRRYFLGLQ